MVILDLSHKGLSSEDLEKIDLTGVTELNCSHNFLTYLPTLPLTLKELYCFNNLLAYLPDLPSTLEILDCSTNELTVLCTITLPPNLKVLDCSDNYLKNLPELPSTLRRLDCSCNLLTSLSDLPYNLKSIHHGDNLKRFKEYVRPLKLAQHNEKRKKLGLEQVGKLPKKDIWDKINNEYIALRYVPGGDMFINAQQEITKLLSEN